MLAYKIEKPETNLGNNCRQPCGSLLMSSESLDQSSTDDSSGGSSRTGSWIVLLLQPKIVVPLFLFLLLISAPMAYRTFRLSRVPPADEPFDTKSVLEFVVPDTENAFVEFNAASVLHVDYVEAPGDSSSAHELFEDWALATGSERKWLAANRAFMELWRKGTAKPDAQYCRASELRADTALLSVQETREFSRLVRLEASRLLVEGKIEEAWDWLRASFRMSRQIGRHGVMIERLVGAAIHAQTAQGMVKWASDPQVTADLLRRAMRELQDEQRRTPPLSACLKLEYLFVIASWMSLTDGPANPTLNKLTGESELNERVFRHLFANWLGQADTPRQQRTKTLPGLFVFEPSPASAKTLPSASELSGYVQQSVMASLLVPSVQGTFTAIDREAARDTVLLTVPLVERDCLRGRLTNSRGPIQPACPGIARDLARKVPERAR